MAESHATAVSKGWWEKERSFGDLMANVHAEVSEAFEAYREGDDMQVVARELDGKPIGIASELADVLIRIFDLCEELNIPLCQALEDKMSYNKRRPYRHGYKRA